MLGPGLACTWLNSCDSLMIKGVTVIIDEFTNFGKSLVRWIILVARTSTVRPVIAASSKFIEKAYRAKNQNVPVRRCLQSEHSILYESLNQL